MRLDYDKALNLALHPEHAEQASRIIRCVGTAGCDRTVVEYGPHVSETRHANGISELALKTAQAAGAVVVDGLCDHHGGVPYSRYAPVMPTGERDTV